MNNMIPKMKLLVIPMLLFFAGIGHSQDTETLAWPRAIQKGDYTINLYQPQLETLEGNMLDGRMALSVKNKAEEMVFGALWFTVRLDTDMSSRTAVLEDIEINKVLFPDIKDEAKIAKLKEVIKADIESTDMVMSLDKIISSLETVAAETEMEGEFNNNPPEIYFRQDPTVLVVLDGEPKLKTVENSKLEYVVNTPFFIAKHKNKFYLKGGSDWYLSDQILGENWGVTNKVPKEVEKTASKKFEDSPVIPDSLANSSTTSKVIVTDKPSEIVITRGAMEYKPISGTSLLYVTNTERDLILNINTQEHFLLLNGRWYATKTLKDKEWNFVEPSELPEDFANIPADQESIASVRASVPGTPEAEEAKYAQYIPQTAAVDKKTATTKVEYDGEPKFESIEGTSLAHAVNTASTVIKTDKRYYVVDDGIWFESQSAKGPWKVAESRPDEVEEIPPSSPVHNVKYVYIYDSTPDVVYVGYTPGYYHSYMYGGVVIYGTGYYYQPWYGYYYYPRPVTYGFGVHYNPYTGWGFSVGVSYGWLTLSYGHYGYWGPGGYMHGYRHGYYHGYHHGYMNGYRAGYARGRYDARNAYQGNRYRTSRPGVETRQPVANRGRSNVTNPGNRSGSATRRNDLYADRSGNVHQRAQDGSWQQKRNNRSSQGVQQRSLDQSQREALQRQRSQLERDYSKRSRGNTNYRNYSRSRPNTGVRSGSRPSIPRRRN